VGRLVDDSEAAFAELLFHQEFANLVPGGNAFGDS
jgi:hypothetical protein